jgi:hypothetical protein
MPAAPQHVLTVQAEPAGHWASLVQAVAVAQTMLCPHHGPRLFALVKQEQLAPQLVSEAQVVAAAQTVHVGVPVGLHAPPAAQVHAPAVQPQNGRHTFVPVPHPFGMQAEPAGHWQLF